MERIIIPEDIENRLYQDFFDEYELAFDLICLLYSQINSLRVIRCVIHLAKGNIEDLNYYLDRAKNDWRDVIYWAEYDENDQHIFYFDKPFPNGLNRHN